MSPLHWAILALIAALVVFRRHWMRILGWSPTYASDAARSADSRRGIYIWLVGFAFAVVIIIGGGVLERTNADDTAELVLMGAFLLGWPILGHVLRRYWRPR